MTPRLRKLALTAHVTASVGWLGSAVAFIGLTIVGMSGTDAQRSHVMLLMEPIAWLVIVPFAVGSLLTGIVQSLGTRWGLIRHQWVVAKLLINVVACVILLLYMRILGHLADVAAKPRWSAADLALLDDPAPMLHAAVTVLLLLVATALSVHKPRGMTRYGRRRRQDDRGAPR